jgi:hypothetical protein
MSVEDVVRRLKIREEEAEAQGLLQLANDLRMAIMELERLERYRLRVSRGEGSPRRATSS